ncbi:MAG TPA: tetratricopeptide repeat protein [Kofleriaceae bacterium]|nr:tetratricopeptide repeat protein [Kofleriaceae bacterium]
MRPFAAIALGLALAAAGCGGAAKKGKTTPSGTGGGSDASSMKDSASDPTAGGDDQGGGSGADQGGGSGAGSDDQPGAGSGSGSGGDQGDGAGSGSAAAEPAPPPIVPPNYDTSPEQAQAQVQKHLAAAKAYLSQKPPDSDSAIREAKATLAADGTNIDAIVAIAHANYDKRLYDTAEVILDDLYKHRSSSQSNPYLYYVYGLVYDATGEDQKAFLAYQKATELDPNDASALVNLGVHQLANKKYDDAVTTYEKLTGQLSPKDPVSWNGLGDAYRGKSADFEATSPERATWLLKAEAAFKQAQTLDRNYGAAYYNLGLLYLDADPFPDPSGQPYDTLVRLNMAKTYFDEYKNLPGVDMKLYDERTKDVTKLIKREEKKRKKDAAGAPGGAGAGDGGAGTSGGTPEGGG